MIDRAAGCLIGSAIGDAMGMPASFMSPDMIRHIYGRIDDFLTPASQQIAHGGLHQAEVTDDTEESLIISEVLCEAKGFEEALFIHKMKQWAIEKKMLESTVIGPSTRRFLETIIAGGDYQKAAEGGDTNGGAMRVAPIGIFFHGSPQACLKAAIASALPSHGSKPAVAATAAVAVAVALATEGGYTPQQIIEVAAEAAEEGEAAGHDIPAPSVSVRIRLAKRIVEEHTHRPLSDVAYLLYQHIGAGMKSYESIPLSLGVFYAAQGGFRDGLITVINIGDDADTNGAITGALCGAFSGLSAIPKGWQERIGRENGIDFRSLAERLLLIE